ncbi:hypothetical protein JHK82_027472 [Glycine max]|nr:hypothetical protein JHK86_027596 [Glycine max]KAG5126637.1 hypothetical protein JHK82_027472 [Glycine max]
MEEWWGKTQGLLVEGGLTYDSIRQSVVELLQKDARLAAIGELGKACPGGATVFEICSPTKTVILDPSLKFLTFDDVTFYDR